MPRRNQSAWQIIRTAARDFGTDDVTILAASLAFFTALSLSPILVILIAVTGFLGAGAQQQLVDYITETVGPGAAQTIHTVVENARDRPTAGTFSAIAGFAVLLFSATRVFAQLQRAMNRIWNVKTKPGQGIKGAFRKRVLSLGMILAIGFILLVSLAVSAALGALLRGDGIAWDVLNFAISLAVYVLLFAAMFKILPDVELEWRHVWRGAILTAILFAIGKLMIDLYLGRTSVGSPFGAAGSLIVLLVWVYFSALIVFFGTELTQAWLLARGERVVPEPHAEWATAKAAERWAHAEREARPSPTAARSR